MIMKMHSYMTVNGHLQYASMKSKDLLDELQLATKAVGGWERAIVDAKSHREERDTSTEVNTSDGTPTIGTPDRTTYSKTSYVDADTASALRKRLIAVASGGVSNHSRTFQIAPKTAGSSTPPSDTDLNPPNRPHPLVDHPDEKISALAKSYQDLQNELTSSGPNAVQWPENITLRNFALYQLIPTLVYEMEYPRTDQ